jgi:hypothetical protein
VCRGWVLDGAAHHAPHGSCALCIENTRRLITPAGPAGPVRMQQQSGHGGVVGAVDKGSASANPSTCPSCDIPKLGISLWIRMCGACVRDTVSRMQVVGGCGPLKYKYIAVQQERAEAEGTGWA